MRRRHGGSCDSLEGTCNDLRQHAASARHPARSRPLWRESRFGLEPAALRRSPVFARPGVPAGDGRPVLLIPGFLAGDGSLGDDDALAARERATTRAAPGIRANVGCSEEACARLEARLEALRRAPRRARRRSSARAAAACSPGRSPSRRPDLVEGIVTLGSPTVSPAARPPARARPGRARRRARHRPRARACSRVSCLRGDCCERFRAAIDRPVPGGRRLRRDVLAQRRRSSTGTPASTRPPTSSSRSRASHCGMGVNAQAYREVAFALGAASRGRRPAARRPPSRAQPRTPRAIAASIAAPGCLDDLAVAGREPRRVERAQGLARSRARSGGARSRSAGSGKRGLAFAVVATPPSVE